MVVLQEQWVLAVQLLRLMEWLSVVQPLQSIKHHEVGSKLLPGSLKCQCWLQWLPWFLRLMSLTSGACFYLLFNVFVDARPIYTLSSPVLALGCA